MSYWFVRVQRWKWQGGNLSSNCIYQLLWRRGDEGYSLHCFAVTFKQITIIYCTYNKYKETGVWVLMLFEAHFTFFLIYVILKNILQRKKLWSCSAKPKNSLLWLSALAFLPRTTRYVHWPIIQWRMNVYFQNMYGSHGYTNYILTTVSISFLAFPFS